MYTFTRTAECISKLRTRPHEMSGLAPIYKQLEIFTELLFFPPQYGENNVYYQNKGIQIYSEKLIFIFFPMTFGKKKK